MTTRESGPDSESYILKDGFPKEGYPSFFLKIEVTGSTGLKNDEFDLQETADRTFRRGPRADPDRWRWINVRINGKRLDDEPRRDRRIHFDVGAHLTSGRRRNIAGLVLVWKKEITERQIELLQCTSSKS